MKILIENPPNIAQISAKFQLHAGIIYTYGDIIYNPDNGPIDDFIIRHEETHCKQQGDKPQEWWDKYCEDKEFRLSQELEAYGEQYVYAKNELKGGKMLERLLNNLAQILSSEIYGNILTMAKAKCKIKNYAKKNRLST